MNALNYFDDWPIILLSSDAQLIEYERVNELETKNKYLTTGLVVLFAITTALISYYIIQEEKEKGNKK